MVKKSVFISLFTAIMVVAILPCDAKAEYIRTGPATAYESHGFGIKSVDELGSRIPTLSLHFTPCPARTWARRFAR